MRVVFFVCFVTWLSCGTLRPDEPARKLHISQAGSVFSSSNGFTFATVPDHRSRLVRIDARYPIGAAMDPPGKEGLAHFVEHLLFEVGFQRDGRAQTLTQQLAESALSWNAMTGPDFTHYEVTATADQLDAVLRIEADRARARCELITDEIFEREREVVLNELRQRLGTDGGDLRAQFHAALYPEGHPYRGSDTVDTVRAITREDVCSFINGPMRVGQATVVVTGAVRPEDVQAAVTKHFSGVPPRILEGHRVPAPVAPKPHRVTIEADVTEPTLMFAWAVPPRHSPEFRQVQLVRSDIQSRMMRLAYTYEWGSQVTTLIAGGNYSPFLILAVTLRKQSDQSQARDAVENALEHGFRSIYKSGEERDDFWWQETLRVYETRALSRYDSMAGRGQMFSDFLTYEPQGGFLVGLLQEMRQTHPKTVRATAEKYLDVDKASEILIVPGKTVGRRLNVGSVFTPNHDAAYGIPVDPKDADRPLSVDSARTLLVPTTRYTLKNGLKVILWQQNDLPLVYSSLVVSSGSSHEPKGAEGLTSLLSFDEVQEDSMVYWQRGLATVLDLLLEDVIDQLRYPGGEMDGKSRDFLRARLRVPGADAVRNYNTLFFSALYGSNHPYARPSMTPGSVDSLTTDRITGWARKHIVPANSTLVVAGDFATKMARNWIAYHAEHVSNGADSAPTDPVPPANTTSFVLGRGDADAPSVDFWVAFPGVPGVGTDAAARRVLSEILEARLSTLRQQLAVSYGMSATYVTREAGGYWSIRGEVDAARAAEAATALQETLLELLHDPGAYRGDFVLARRKTYESLLAGTTSVAEMSSRLEHMARFDLPDDYYVRLADSTAALTIDDVRLLIERELVSGRQVFGAFGAPDAARAALSAADERLKAGWTPKPANGGSDVSDPASTDEVETAPADGRDVDAAEPGEASPVSPP